MKTKIFLLLLFSLIFTAPVLAADKIKIVTTTATFASLAREIVGETAEIYSIASPHRDIHFIAPTPKDVLKTKKADVFMHAGLDLEAWRDPLLDAAGKPELLRGGKRNVDLSRNIELLEIPSNASRSQGDIHLFGNPHYWINPENGKIIAANMAQTLSVLYPDQAQIFNQNLAAFEEKLNQKIKIWQNELSPYQNTKVITYHNSWPYLMKFLNFQIAGFIEPKPGIPPTAKHIAALTNQIRDEQIPLIIQETYYEKRTAERLAKTTGAKIVHLAIGVEEVKPAGDFMALMDFNVDAIKQALQTKENL